MTDAPLPARVAERVRLWDSEPESTDEWQCQMPMPLVQRALGIDAARALHWAFAQAVLAAAWSIEAGERVDMAYPFLQLARPADLMLAADVQHSDDQ